MEQNGEKELLEKVTEVTYMEKYMCAINCLKSIIETYAFEKDKEFLVYFRMKSPESIKDKLVKKGYEISYENAVRYLSDLAGIRIVCASVDSVYEMDRYLVNHRQVKVIRRKDYIKKPKKNGYQSIHLIVETDGLIEDKTKVEIQIRTAAMHCWAERDHRLCYKSR